MCGRRVIVVAYLILMGDCFLRGEMESRVSEKDKKTNAATK